MKMIVAAIALSVAVGASAPTFAQTKAFPPSTASEKADNKGFPPSTASEKADRTGLPPSTTSEKADTKGFPPSTASEKSNPMNLTDTDAKNWVGKPVYSSDGKKLGSVALIERDTAGNITDLQADIGGFLGLGETRIRAMPAQFTLGTDRVVLNVPADGAKSLPQVNK
jgi:hypothetical protein